MCGEWVGFGASVRGASHKRKGRPNEDAWGMWQSEDRALLLGVVADGHGSAQSLRSRVGSALAVEAAREVVSDQAASLQSLDERGAGEAGALLLKAIVERWRQKVGEQLLRDPLRPHELDELDEQERVAVLLDPLRAYGSTFLMALNSPAWTLFIGVGDGQILWVSSAGIAHRVFKEDPRFIANETTSLCSSSVNRDAQIQVFDRRVLDPALLVLCTDGVSNAFADESGFVQLGSDLWEDFQERCWEEIEADLPGWLDSFSEEGSGDDATICLLRREAKEEVLVTSVEEKSAAPVVASLTEISVARSVAPLGHASGIQRPRRFPTAILKGFDWLKTTVLTGPEEGGDR